MIDDIREALLRHSITELDCQLCASLRSVRLGEIYNGEIRIVHCKIFDMSIFPLVEEVDQAIHSTCVFGPCT